MGRCWGGGGMGRLVEDRALFFLLLLLSLSSQYIHIPSLCSSAEKGK